MKTIIYLTFSLFLMLGTASAQDNVAGCEAFMPAVFSVSVEQPNLELQVVDVSEARLLIFDRQGQKIFESVLDINYLPEHITEDKKKSRKIDSGWGGKRLGKELDAGTYFYILNATCTDESTQQWKGYISLLRE